MKTRIGLLIALGALPLVLAACGGGGAKAGASSSSTTTEVPSGSSNGARDTSAFRQCLSEHGVTLPSGNFGGPPGGANGSAPNGSAPNGSLPNPGANGGPPQGGFSGGNDPKFQQAIQACRSKLPNGTFPNGGRGGGFGQNSQAFQAYTSCLKDHGVKVPARPSGANAAANPGGLRNLQSDPKFTAANNTCQVLLPARNAGNGATTTTVGS
jgi:ABC-type glycerol-3-phosphate transport system substrate-binding protein